ncbi:MAG: VOC family protein [Actinomycetota bacterium]|nr:VOC family protein [Actinomycetota bacterium]
MTGEMAWFEMGVPDATRAQSFYGTLLGWTFESMGEGGAVIHTAGERAGLHAGDDARQIVTYFHVDDIDASVEKVRELGGEADDPGPAEEGFGRFVTCRDDQGVAFGLRQAR